MFAEPMLPPLSSQVIDDEFQSIANVFHAFMLAARLTPYD